MEIIPVLHNIRSCYNVGAILRTAEGLGVSKVILSGYTPKVHDEKLLPHLREKLDREIHKTALGAEEMLEIVNVANGAEAQKSSDWMREAPKPDDTENLRALLLEFSKQDFKIAGLENNIEKPLCQINSPRLHEELGKKVVLILGEEVNGISPELYDLIDVFIEIPMKGQKESFNVSVAAGIALFELSFRKEKLSKRNQ